MTRGIDDSITCLHFTNYCHHGGIKFYPPVSFNFGSDWGGLLVFIHFAINILEDNEKRKTSKTTEHRFLKKNLLTWHILFSQLLQNLFFELGS